MRARTGFLALALAIVAAGLLGAEEPRTGSVWESKKSAWVRIPAADREAALRFGEDYKRYLNAARSAAASTAEVGRVARAAGFSEFTEAAQVKPGARLLVNDRDRALILLVVGSEPVIAGSRAVGTHHDSPTST